MLRYLLFTLLITLLTTTATFALENCTKVNFNDIIYKKIDSCGEIVGKSFNDEKILDYTKTYHIKGQANYGKIILPPDDYIKRENKFTTNTGWGGYKFYQTNIVSTFDNLDKNYGIMPTSMLVNALQVQPIIDKLNEEWAKTMRSKDIYLTKIYEIYKILGPRLTEYEQLASKHYRIEEQQLLGYMYYNNKKIMGDKNNYGSFPVNKKIITQINETSKKMKILKVAIEKDFSIWKEANSQYITN